MEQELDFIKLIKNNIKLLESCEENKNVMRKAVNSDFFGNSDQNINNLSCEGEKIKKYRLQGEHGEKKFIKP